VAVVYFKNIQFLQ